MKFKYCPPAVKFPLSSIPPQNISISSEYMELEELMGSILKMADDENSTLYRLIIDSFEKGREILEINHFNSIDYTVKNSRANVALRDIITEFIAKEVFSAKYLYIDELLGTEFNIPVTELIKGFDDGSEENKNVVAFIKSLALNIGTLIFATIDKLIYDVLYKHDSKSVYNNITKILNLPYHYAEESVQETDNFS